MKKSVFKISKMDCPSEEQLVRMKLNGDKTVANLIFNLSNRTLTAFHTGDEKSLLDKLNQLKLDTHLISSDLAEFQASDEKTAQRKLLWIVFLINLGFFILELVTGFIANSMGLVADSLDMMADAIVYGLSLYAVGRLATTKKRIAKIGGLFQMTLAIMGFIEVLRRFIGLEQTPVFQTMILISLFALLGNSVTLYLLQKSKSKEAHMQASMIFTSNDVIANIGVIIAGALVYFTKSIYPDLIIGTIIFLLVAGGSVKIFKLSQ